MDPPRWAGISRPARRIPDRMLSDIASPHAPRSRTMFRTRLLALAALAAALAINPATLAPGAQQKEQWTQLFNGRDLDGWDTWLGKPYKATEPVGLNKDPKGVYSVVTIDGKPAVRISGEIFGAITTKKEFENYHVRLQFKWGEKKWPPRENTVRD